MKTTRERIYGRMSEMDIDQKIRAMFSKDNVGRWVGFMDYHEGGRHYAQGRITDVEGDWGGYERVYVEDDTSSTGEIVLFASAFFPRLEYVDGEDTVAELLATTTGDIDFDARDRLQLADEIMECRRIREMYG